MRITGGQVFDLHEGFVQRDVCFDGRLLSNSSADGKTYDASGCYVIPGLTDVHFHGCKGRDFSDADPEGLEIMAQYELSRGVTQICPAGMTLLEDQLTRVCQVAAAHKEADKPGAALCGINLEGPFLSMAKKGAQNGDWLHAPDVDMLRRLIAASHGLVKLVSLAPEEPGAMEFLDEMKRNGILLGIATSNNRTLAEAALRNEPLRIFGTGKQTRCFCHVADTVRALRGLIGREEAYGHIYNIGSTRSITIEDLAKLVITELNSGSSVEYIPYDKAYESGFEDMLHRAPDCSAIGRLTGWKAEISLEQIIRDVAESMKKN